MVGHVVTVNVKTHHSNNVHEKDPSIIRISVVRSVLLLVSEKKRTGLFTHGNKVATRELEERSSLSERRHVSTERETSLVKHPPAGDTVRGESERHDLRAAENLPLRKAVRKGRVQQ